MKNVPVNEDLIWAFIDGVLEADEKEKVVHLLAADDAWQQHYALLLSLHQQLTEQPLEQPSMRFAKNVMEAIGQYHIAPATKTYISKFIIHSIAAFFILIILGLLGYSVATSPSTTGPATTIYDSILGLDFASIFSSGTVKIVLMINVVLALVLLESWLSSRRKSWA